VVPRPRHRRRRHRVFPARVDIGKQMGIQIPEESA
jgi:hypothetical protein